MNNPARIVSRGWSVANDQPDVYTALQFLSCRMRTFGELLRFGDEAKFRIGIFLDIGMMREVLADQVAVLGEEIRAS